MKKMNIELDMREEPTPDSRDWGDTNHNSQGPEEVPMHLSSQNSGSDPFSHDSVVDLDMDAIIQSFINEQASHSSDIPLQDAQRLHPPTVFATLQSQLPGDGYGQAWGMFDLTGDESFDDTLFGMS